MKNSSRMLRRGRGMVLGEREIVLLVGQIISTSISNFIVNWSANIPLLISIKLCHKLVFWLLL